MGTITTGILFAVLIGIGACHVIFDHYAFNPIQAKLKERARRMTRWTVTLKDKSSITVTAEKLRILDSGRIEFYNAKEDEDAFEYEPVQGFNHDEWNGVQKQ